MHRRHRRSPCLLRLPLALCTVGACAPDDARTSGFDAPPGDTSGTDTAGSSAAATGETDDDRPPSSTGATGPKFDLDDDGGPEVDDPICHVVDDLDAIGVCGEREPTDTFDAVVEWTWPGPPGAYVLATPVVANLTDDDDNGSIDLCDVPDVVVVVGGSGEKGEAELWVLDGATGTEHFRVPGVAAQIDPALGDIDGDGSVEIIAAVFGEFGSDGRYLAAFEHDGALVWQSTVAVGHHELGYAIALADIDADGDVEIVAHDTVLDHEGDLVWRGVAPQTMADHTTATAVADLDGDGRSEVIVGQTAYDASGDLYYEVPQLSDNGFPQIANLDDDPHPEVLLLTSEGATVLEHDGTIKLLAQRPTADHYHDWAVPTFIHDLDADGRPASVLISDTQYLAVDRELSPSWALPLSEIHGAGTAFDFLGDGRAEAVVVSDEALSLFDGAGQPVLLVDHPVGSTDRSANPIVVDVDNDGSAEILVVGRSPALRVVGDASNRWVGARRIWNQHTYHVTNVREDGTIPQHEPPSWGSLNTYRANAQIDAGGVCTTPPAG